MEKAPDRLLVFFGSVKSFKIGREWTFVN
jgi:hypothetical protein